MNNHNLFYEIEVNGYEAWQNSLFYVFVRFFGPDPAQNTIGRD